VRKRTLARELALKALYQHELRGGVPLEELFPAGATGARAEVYGFARELTEGCLANRQMLDELIQRTAENWRLDRMPVIDRNILRLGTYELLFRPDIPPKVCMNEAIELAKKFSTENSPTFVNGVLDKICSTYVEPLRGQAEDTSEDAEARRAQAEECIEDAAQQPEALADLHVHSSASDGSLSPREVVDEARRAGLAAIALADHDTVAGIAEAMERARESGLCLVPGVELTAYARLPACDTEVELHVQGLFLDTGDASLLAELERLRNIRVARIESIAERLRSLGIPLETREVLERAQGESVGRLHVAHALVQKGICADVREAFDRFLGVGCPAYVPKEHLTPQQAIELVHRAGGCAVLCHPALTKGLEEMLPELVEAGLDAVEVDHPGHSYEDRRKWRQKAARLGLALSGGSDFHGAAKLDVRLGDESLPLARVAELLSRARAYRRASGSPTNR